MAYTIPDFGPNDLLSSEKIDERRVKTASMSAADVAALNSKLYSIAAPYSIQAGQSASYNIDLSGIAIIYEIQADGLSISINSEKSTGVLSDISPARNLNFAKPNGFAAFAQKVNSFTINGYTAISCASPCRPSVVSDELNSFAVTLKNNTSSALSGFMLIRLESLGEYLSPFGLTADTNLSAGTEMSYYG